MIDINLKKPTRPPSEPSRCDGFRKSSHDICGWQFAEGLLNAHTARGKIPADECGNPVARVVRNQDTDGSANEEERPHEDGNRDCLGVHRLRLHEVIPESPDYPISPKNTQAYHNSSEKACHARGLVLPANVDSRGVYMMPSGLRPKTGMAFRPKEMEGVYLLAQSSVNRSCTSGLPVSVTRAPLDTWCLG